MIIFWRLCPQIIGGIGEEKEENGERIMDKLGKEEKYGDGVKSVRIPAVS